jgi:hypothetical protein
MTNCTKRNCQVELVETRLHFCSAICHAPELNYIGINIFKNFKFRALKY